VVRYWAVCGLLQMGESAKKAVPALKKTLTDSSAAVAITAAEALYRMGFKTVSRQAILQHLSNPEIMIQLLALNVIDNSCWGGEVIRNAVEGVAIKQQLKKNEYISRMTEWILNKP